MRKTTSKFQLQLRSRLLPGLLILLLILELISPYRGWRILLVGLGGAWTLGCLWVWSLARGLDLTREMRFGWMQVGDQMVERFTLVNDSWASALWIEIVDHSTLPDYQASRGTGIESHHSIRWHKKATCTRRGLFTLGPTSLRTGDPFGLFTVTLYYPASFPMLVLPPVVPLPSVEVTPGGRTDGKCPQPDAPNRTVSAASVREYLPSDSLRWIHWPTSARHDSLFVRLFDGAPASNCWILLDADRRVQVGQGANSTIEHGVILAASLADRELRQGRMVGFAAQGEKSVWLPPRQGKGQRLEILRSLALISSGSHSLADVLTRSGSSAFGRYASVVIITPATGNIWVEALIPLLQSGITPTVLLLDPVSFGGFSKMHKTAASLSDLGVAHHIISRDLLDTPEARPGQRGLWEWRTLGTGHAVPVHRPHQTSWRALS